MRINGRWLQFPKYIPKIDNYIYYSHDFNYRRGAQFGKVVRLVDDGLWIEVYRLETKSYCQIKNFAFKQISANEMMAYL